MTIQKCSIDQNEKFNFTKLINLSNSKFYVRKILILDSKVNLIEILIFKKINFNFNIKFIIKTYSK